MRKLLVAAAVLVGSGLAWSGCSQNTVPVVVRSLEKSGRATFLCVDKPAGYAKPGDPLSALPLDACFVPGGVPTQFDYGVPHVLSLVTQTARGEVAVVDVTADTVVDADRTLPGYTFLPVGAMPTDIVSTPGSSASFVGIGDPSRPGIFAIPTQRLPLLENAKPPTLASWPACALPPGGAPTEMLIVNDVTPSASDRGDRRAHCDGSPSEIETGLDRGTDLVSEIRFFGRPKLIVQLPELGEIDVIDAQELLARPAGSFDPCTIERRILLAVDANLPPVTPPSVDGGKDAAPADGAPAIDGSTGSDDGSSDDVATNDAPIADDAAVGDAGTSGDSGAAPDAGDDGSKCSGTSSPKPPVGTTAHPHSMALSDDGRLFISDDVASVIHVIDVSDPCAAAEKAPLLPFSALDPSRPVLSGAIAVSPLTTDGKRFVYAVDIKNSGSVMVFDVSTTSKERTPLLRPDRLYNPLEAPDRIAVLAPVESLTFATQEVPYTVVNQETGEVPRGVACDPTDPNDKNRPADDFVSAGAGPRRLRGTFAFLAMTNGQLAVVDLDDYDMPCRRPKLTSDPALGCSPDTQVPGPGFASSSQEVSCNVVERHRLRSSKFFTNDAKAGVNAPAMLSFPVLYDQDGTSLNVDTTQKVTENLPKLLGPALVEAEHDTASWPLLATVTSSATVPGPDPAVNLVSTPADALANWVTFDLREPRAHISQGWNIRYEGPLPWFVGHRGRLQCSDASIDNPFQCETGDNPSHFDFYDSSIGFCDGGAQGADMAPGGDILEILDDLPDPADPYWTTVTNQCSRQLCENVFGTLDALRTIEPNGDPVGRDILIEKSYQDRLSLRPSHTENPANRDQRVPLTCCFPYPVAYTVRASKHWIITGDRTGFAHHLIPDPNATDNSKVACVPSCDPNLQLRTGRVVARKASEPVLTYDDPGVFRNAQLRFVLWDVENEACANDPTTPCAARVRDRFFSFNEVGGFTPLTFGLSSSSLVMPQSIRYVRGIQVLAIPDPVGMGLMLFDLKRLATVSSFY